MLHWWVIIEYNKTICKTSGITLKYYHEKITVVYAKDICYVAKLSHVFLFIKANSPNIDIFFRTQKCAVFLNLKSSFHAISRTTSSAIMKIGLWISNAIGNHKQVKLTSTTAYQIILHVVPVYLAAPSFVHDAIFIYNDGNIHLCRYQVQHLEGIISACVPLT